MGTATSRTHEGGEIVGPQKSLESIQHSPIIQILVIAMPAPGIQKKVGPSTVVDEVAVTPVDRRVTGVPVVRTKHRFPDPDRRRQTTIESRSPFAGGDRAAAIKMNDLACSMHPGICSSCCYSSDRSMGIKGGDRLLQFRLNTATVALSLPAAEAGSLVLQTESNPVKCRRFS